MACVETRSRGRKFLGRVDYFESADLPHGVLPTKKAVIETVKKRCSRYVGVSIAGALDLL